ncbi:Phospholipase/Carboxylesterase family protein [Durotheca rogersii]|uniref:Phospholipase/Carboxylesterase family protein n=1 Tax=Durotheca rogersii TaxID=419775 RepID=UPI00221EC50E|nr:Phospholipase/Carboxylesterase family protein [Durotheca rogersii]KAI5854496.1 Phospholipase/Carboxylesterase family protein [Durotheca rogersii]
MDLSVRIIPPTVPHTHTVVFLHGRGDNTQNFISSLDHSRDSRNRTLLDTFPSFRWVFPQAKIRACAASPRQTMTQWFDIWNVADFSEQEDLQAIGLRESVASLGVILEREAAILGDQWDCLVLAGISQGAATNVHTLLNLNLTTGQNGMRRLGAFLGFSCRMPFPGRTLTETRSVLGLEATPDNDEVIRNTPVLLEHCSDDLLVLVEGGRNLRDTLRRFGAQVVWKEYSEGGHWFNSPAGIDDAVEFLSSVLLTQRPDTNSSAQTQISFEAMDLS